ncbi:MAG: TraR/DksA family transcriptional regulator [Phycisphaerales bacterium]|nr:MAG: TraR/DksA family transcriptional regulator [Phycisphaerales bacterium]
MDEARAAASRLAASAGMAPIQSGSSLDTNASARKPRSNKSPLSKKDLEEYKQLLVHKRGEIVGDVSAMETEALTGGGSGSLSNLPQHMADQGSDTYDQSLSLDLAASQRKLLKEIDAALERIDNGTYGVCEMMGVPIGKARLNAKPWAKYCIEAARQMEMRPYMR